MTPSTESDSLPAYDLEVVASRGARKARLVVRCLDEHNGVMRDRDQVVELIDALNTALARLRS